MNRAVAIAILLIGNSVAAFDLGVMQSATEGPSARPGIDRSVSEAFATRFCYAQYRHSDDVMRCLGENGR